jgi:hypothetical protein
MKIAFLGLIYDNFVNYDYVMKFLLNGNIYIHSKYPDKINKDLKKSLIPTQIDTAWGSSSIVDATLELLKYAYEDKTNGWFILLSQDCYPIYSYEEFLEKFNKIKEKSSFNYINKTKNLWKTSQWWILTRKDVELIISNLNKYDIIIKNEIKKMMKTAGAYDELYFLSLLKRINTNYEYNNIQIMYDRWLSYTIQKSPVIFNKIFKDDLDEIQSKGSLFIRKVLDNFKLDIQQSKRKVYIITIGEGTDQNNIIFKDDFDIIILTFIDINKILPHIIKRSVYIYKVIYKFYYETVLDLSLDKHFNKWSIIIFTTETFNINNYNKIVKIKNSLPYKNFIFDTNKLKNKKIENDKKYYYIIDNKNQYAFCYKKN